MDPTASAFIDIAERTGRVVRRVKGTVTDISVNPPLIDCGGGAVATEVVGPYDPRVGHRVVCLEDWDGQMSGTRICIGPEVGGDANVVLQRVANQSATGSANTTISWDTENLDVGDWWTSGTTLTVPYDGIYAVHARVTGAAAWAADSATVIVVGGTTVGLGTANGVQAVLPANAALRMTATNAITVIIRNQGATQNCTAVIGVHRIA